MGPVATAVPPSPVPAGKAKKPIPTGIQTNGAGPSPSPSPTMTTKKAPNSAKAASIPLPPTPNGTGSQAQKAPQNRPRREASAQLSRNSRNSVSLRASSITDDMIAQASKPPGNFSRDIKDICRKPPSIIVHLHPTNFRFDQQDGAFSYTSPMKVFLEHIRNRTVPHEHDLLRGLHSSGVPFYEGCLIVQVHDHKSVAQANNTPKAAAKANNATISSIHNYNPYLTPSTTNYPKTEPQPAADSDAGAGGQSVEKKVEEHNKENVLAPPLPTNPKTTPRKPTITTVVLHPTQQSLLAELLLKASTPSATADGKDDALAPPTPATAAPSSTNKTPRPAKRQKREPMEIDGSNINAVEGQILLHTLPLLDLEPARNKEDVIALLEKHEKAQPMHSEPLPKPKARKRTVAEMAADQALIAGQERYMLTLDERLGPAANGAQGASAGGDGDMRGGGAAFEPGFERLRVIMDIKREHAERAEKERLQQVENQKRLEQQRQQQQQQEQQAALQRQQEAERLRRETLQREAIARRQQQQEEAQRKAQQAAQAQAQAQAAKLKQQQAKSMAQAQNANAVKAAAAAKAKATAAAAAAANANANANANAVSNGPLVNGMQSAQAAQRFHQQVSQPQASSPAVRQGTPHSMSSPMVSGVAMQPSNSNMAGSPPRPPSAMQAHTPMAVAMSHSMSARGSQQSHPGGTPRMPNGTPNMAHATPINRPASLQTPRMSQASPPPAMAAQGSQMGQLMGNQAVSQQMLQQNVMAQQLAAQQQQLAAQQKRMLAQQHLGQSIQNGMMNGMNGMNPQNLTPQQQQQLQQHRLQQILMQQQQQQLQQQMQQQQNQLHPQQQQQQQQRAGMMNPLAQQYAQSMSQMQGQLSPQMQAQLQAQMARMNHANQMNQNGGNQMGRPMMPNQAMMNNGDPASMQAALVQMQQMQQQQQQAVQQSQQQQMQQQLQARGQQLYKANFAKFASQFGGAMENIPAEALEKFKKDCMLQARSNVLQMQQARQQQAQAQLQAQHHMAMQQPQGMMGGHQGM